MRVIIQRVSHASVTVETKITGQIEEGLLILVGVEPIDTQADIDWLCKKITGLRIFNDEKGIMNLSVKDIDGGLLVISQFTLHASTKKGNRPSYIRAAKPDIAIPLYQDFIKTLSIIAGKEIQTGEFGADMKVSLLNNGPVTISIDSHSRE